MSPSGPVGAGPLVVAVCDFGWGSLGKLRLILDHLPQTDVALYGDVGINAIATDLLAPRHRFIERSPKGAPVALVINDPAAAHGIAELGVPVIYVDSLPYLWATPEEVPAPDAVALYCAQKFPPDRLPVSEPLQHRSGVEWIDPIVPALRHRQGGEGVVISVGGLYSHLAGATVDAYLSLVLFPLVEILVDSGSPVSAICGNLTAEVCREARRARIELRHDRASVALRVRPPPGGCRHPDHVAREHDDPSGGGAGFADPLAPAAEP